MSAGMKACSSVSTEGEGEPRIDEEGAQHARHLGVGHRLVRAQARSSASSRTAGKPAGSIARHVPAGAFDVEHVDLGAGEVARVRLHRGVAAAVQHQLRLAPDQPRGIDAQRKLGAMPALP